jgi:glutamate racemase
MNFRFFLLGWAMLSTVYAARGQQDTLLESQLTALTQRDSITVLVTDSGLGGLSVCAAVDSLARTTGRYARMRLIFANALPESGSGYNRMGSLDEKVRVFDAALRGMVDAYAPDIVLIACNTLSVVYPQTSYAREARIPVAGIVSMGVAMIAEELQGDPVSAAIVFGTETTIGAGTHKRLLEERGVAADRIILQACPELAGMIERDAAGKDVEETVGRFVDEAAGKRSILATKYIAALCCTHYGYVGGLFQKALKERTGRTVVVVDPNLRMSKLLFPDTRSAVHASPVVNVYVVSRAVITPEEAHSIGTLLEPVSRWTAAALRNYELKRDLFPFSHK